MAQERVLIVAEPGGMHEGKLDCMLAMIQVAAKAGADVIKFQWTSDAAKHAEHRNAPEFAEAYQRIAFPAEWHEKLWVVCQEAKIEYACTVAFKEELETIDPFVKRFKVASFDAGDIAFIGAIEAYCKPIMVSTGMQSAEELRWFLRRRERNPSLKLLHCASAYPAPVDALNLAVIREYGLDGLSDHSGQIVTGGLAVAAGARIVETHFRLDDCDHNNPDFPHSLSPVELQEYVAGVRWAERAMGDGIKRCQPSEEPMKRYRVRGE